MTKQWFGQNPENHVKISFFNSFKLKPLLTNKLTSFVSKSVGQLTKGGSYKNEEKKPT
jgi:hypothetical protein